MEKRGKKESGEEKTENVLEGITQSVNCRQELRWGPGQSLHVCVFASLYEQRV